LAEPDDVEGVESADFDAEWCLGMGYLQAYYRAHWKNSGPTKVTWPRETRGNTATVGPMPHAVGRYQGW